MFESTKFCKDFYKGCTNVNCTFAHSKNAARWGIEYAMEDVYFTNPEGANLDSRKNPIPAPCAEFISQFLPPMIVRFDEDDDEKTDDDEETDDDENSPAFQQRNVCVSRKLSDISLICDMWLEEKHRLAKWTYEWTLRKEYQRLTDSMGEQDMEIE